jgi:hypothetical protein
MKNINYILLLLILFFNISFAQIGIGTTAPDAQLDIRSSNQVSPANNDGIIIPKVDAFPVTNPTVAQQSMLVYLTTATTFGGNPKSVGFYYWDFGSLDWIGISSTANGDHDWYEEGTTTTPNDINDYMFHIGNVAIGKNIATSQLDIENSVNQTTINSLNSYSGASNKYGFFNSLGLSSGNQYGVFNDIVNNGTGDHFGLYNNIVGTGIGIKYGQYSTLSGTGTGNQFGNYTTITNSGGGNHWGSAIFLNSTALSGTRVGNSVDITNNGTGVSTGFSSLFAGTGGGTQTGLFNNFTNSGNGIHYGLQNSLSGTGTGEHLGILNNLSGNGIGAKVGMRSFITSTNTAGIYGVNNIINGGGTSLNYGIYNAMFGNSSGIQNGIYNEITNTGGGIHYGNRNSLSGSGAGIKYGTYNLINSASGGTHYGVFSEVLKPGTTNFAGYFLGNVGIGTTVANTYTLPPSRGLNGQIMRTNGTGVVTWANNSDFAWSLNGNAALASDFIGTTNAQPFRMFTSNLERMTINAVGNVGINIAPSAYKLDVSSVAGDAIFGHSTNVGGVLGYETNFTAGTGGTIQGAGVYASNPTAGYTSLYSQSTGAATVAANINFSNVWIASYNLVDNPSAGFNPPALYSQLNVTNSALGGDQAAMQAFSSRGTTAGNPGFTIGIEATSIAQNQDSFAVLGSAFTNSSTRAGGYFESNSYPGVNQAFAYVASTVGIARKITGTNAVSEIVPTENHGRVTLTCPESPEYWYQDYGTVEMINGRATIILDEILADIIIVDEANPIRVTCTPVAMPYFNGITIMSQTKNSVEVLELNGGNHSGKLQYQLVVRPKTGYGEGRFPQAPGPAYLKSNKEPFAAKAKNQPLDGRKIFYWPADHEVYNYNPEDHVQIGDVIPAGPNAGKVKLGNGKYGNGLPPENPQAKR